MGNDVLSTGKRKDWKFTVDCTLIEEHKSDLRGITASVDAQKYAGFSHVIWSPAIGEGVVKK